MAYSFGKKDFRMPGAAEIEVDGPKRLQTVVLIPSAKPSEHTAHEDAGETIPRAQSVQKLRQAEHCPGLLRKASVDPRTSGK